jgi:predicted Rossmann fold nucleotide-binding protein DprA/Smf involved in DNA uptake
MEIEMYFVYPVSATAQTHKMLQRDRLVDGITDAVYISQATAL